jgi:hypothetical protein
MTRFPEALRAQYPGGQKENYCYALPCRRSLLKSGQQKNGRHQPASVPFAPARTLAERLHNKICDKTTCFPASDGHNKLLTS